MNLQELFQPGDVLVHFHAQDKWDAMQALVQHLEQRGRIPSELSADLLDALVARERSSSTGMEHGIALPHAAVEGLDEIVACLGIVTDPKGINFESIDASPTHLIVLLLIPRTQKLLHIRTLAVLAQVLGQGQVRRALLAAQDSETAWNALSEEAQSSTGSR